MIGYVCVGSNDLDRARVFYEKLFAHLGAKELHRFPSGFTMFGKSWDDPQLCLCSPHDKQAATVGNGTMVAFKAATREQVDSTHALALSLGGKDEGAPGVRGDEGPMAFYGAYFRDLDGNKLAIYRIGPKD
jgi:catechol 2,3-dioxygenase-like lactoylglutathione lyase family enzyme